MCIGDRRFLYMVNNKLSEKIKDGGEMLCAHAFIKFIVAKFACCMVRG
jgi:hypothetical protein